MEKSYTRDVLAKDRTHLANERTFLSYLRTSLALLALGFFLLKFIPSKAIVAFGVAIIISGFILFFYGVRRFFSVKKKIKSGQNF